MEFLQYDIRVAVLVAVFYMFYRLLLSRDSLHQLNRFVLIGTAVASFVLPLCVITVHRTEVVEAVSQAAVGTSVGTVPVVPHVPWWQVLLPIVFWSGFAITLLYTLVSISKVCILISRCERHRQADGTVIAVCDGEVSPFSWMRYIVMSRSDYAQADNAILMHEREHVRRHHSWDVVLVDALTSLQWFNPAMWMLRYDLRSIHEYEADAAVLSSGVDARQYQYLLVRKAMMASGYSVTNGINHSTLKQRITMMNVKKQNKYSWLKALYVLPVVAVSLVTSARTVTDYRFVESAGRDVALTEVETQPVKKASGKSVSAKVKEGEKIVLRDSSVADKPLVIVDGVEKKYSHLQGMNPSDIAGITVLKDKTAKEKYGDKAKHGVLVVTTKKADATAQDKQGGGTKVFDVVEEMPEFKGGSSELMRYLATNIRYPTVAQEWGVQGRFVVGFVVNEDGSLSNIEVLNGNVTDSGKANEVLVVSLAGKEKSDAEAARKKGLEEGRAALEAEAIRVVGSMPAWTPGKQGGKLVKVRYVVPITFRLH